MKLLHRGTTMHRIIATLMLLAIAFAVVRWQQRLRPNEVVLVGVNPRLAVGSPVVSGGQVVGRVERIRRSDDETRVTVAFLRDSQPPIVAESIRVKTTGPGQPMIMEIRAGPQRPVFGPGGAIPGPDAPAISPR